ncbi:glycosyltransferase [bacterium]|nr:glycosyltransferase [bacterium]
MGKICIFIPHHKNPKLLPPLFHSLARMEGNLHDVMIVLVDNGCKDNSIRMVKKKFPEVSIYALDRNEGFAPALNKAVKAQRAEWVCFLNNDVHVHPDWLSHLLKAAQKTKASCLASHILDWEGQATQFAGGWLNLFGKGFEGTALKSDKPYEIFFPCGCGMMIRRDLFMEVGGFDDDYFMVYEDVDLGWRLRLLGHSIYFVPDARVMHHAHASLAQETYSRKAAFYERNSLATLYKNLDEDSLKILLPLAIREALLRAKAASGIGLPMRYHADGVALRKAVHEFLQQEEKWAEKRRTIQQQRQVSDRDIFERFFPYPTQIWCYSDLHYQRAYHPDIKPLIEACFSMAEKMVCEERTCR